MSCVKITKKIGTKQGPECAQHLAYKIIKELLVFLTPPKQIFRRSFETRIFFIAFTPLNKIKVSST